MKQKLLFFVILLTVLTLPQVASAYDFWSVSSTGDTLYYTVWESSTWSGGGYAYLAVTYPEQAVYNDSLGYYDGWGNHLRPSGNVVIPNTVYYNGMNCQVRYIDQHAFSGCRDITSVTIPSNVREIFPYAFEECSGLISLSVPSTVTTIYNSAFTGIPNVIYNGSATGSPWGAQMKNGYVSGDYVYSNSTRQTLVAARRNITTAVIPSTVTMIADKAFQRCHNLTSVSIPSNITSIGASTFEWCSSLQHIDIPSNIATIGSFSFLRCHNLRDVSFSIGLTSIGYGAFEECTSLSRVELPVGLHKVEYSAFMDCENLNYISFPYTIDTLGTQILDGCGNLDTIVFDANIQDPSAPYAFSFLNLPDGVSPEITLLIGPHVTSIQTNEWTNQWLFNQLNSYLSEVVMQCDTPPSCLSPCVGNNVPLKVPCMSLSAYQSSNWNCYVSIQSYQPFKYTLQETYPIGTVSYTINCNVLSLVANPVYGYDFVMWSDNDTNRSRTLLLTQDTLISAVFMPHVFTVDAYSNNTVLGNTTVSGGFSYLDTAVFTALASPHSHFVSWSDGSVDNPHIIIVDRDTTLIALFEIDTYYVTLMSINPVFGDVFGQGQFEYGAVDTLRAIANDGYIFTHWNDFSIDNPRTVTVTQDTLLIAHFTKVQMDTLILKDTVFFGIHDTTIVRDTTVLTEYIEVPYPVHDTTYVDVPYPVHDTTIVRDTTVLTEYVYVFIHDTTTLIDTLIVNNYIHDTGTVVIVDTLLIDNYIYDTVTLTEYVPVHDTTYIDVPYAVHDTTYVYRYLHDTTIVNNYVHDTTFITQQFYDTVTVVQIDTVINNHFIHDTSYVYRYLHDTTVVNNYIHDTTLVTNFIHDTVIVNRYIYDSTYIDRIVHDTVLLYRYVHDTTNVTFYDTLIFNHYVHDTTILNNYIHDTTFVDNWIYDTAYVTLVDTLTVTLWDTITQNVYVHDTTILNNYIHDTTFVDNWIYDTAYVTLVDTLTVTLWDTITQNIYVHDTTILNNYIHDTTFVDNWIYDTTYIWQYDTTIVTLTDTLLVDVFVHDTTIVDNWIYDTTYIDNYIHDTTTVLLYDTVYVTEYDTVSIMLYDTITLHDTVTMIEPLTYYSVSVTSANISQGLGAGNGTFPDNTTIEIAAIPLEGFRFTQWNDGNGDNPRTMTVNGDLSFTALFEASDVAVNAPEGDLFEITTSQNMITVTGASGERIRLFDTLGRLLAVSDRAADIQTFATPATGAYYIQIGNRPARKVVVVR